MSKSFLIVQIGKLGDMVLTTPLFYGLKEIFSNSIIHVICSETNSNVSMNDPAIDSFFILRKNINSSYKLLNKLRKNNYDFFVDVKPEYSKTTALLKKFSRFGSSFGYNTGKIPFQIDLNKYRKGNHYTDYATAILNYFENDEYSKRPLLYCNEANVHSNIKKLSGSGYIFINTTSGKPARIWKENNFIELLEMITGQLEIPVILNNFGASLKFTTSLTGNQKICVPHMNYDELLYVIKHSILTISPDTSSIHIASANNIPVIGLYNNVKWNLERFYPLSDQKKVFVSENENNLESIKPSEVFEAIKEML